MNISLTADDIVAAATIGGIVITPIVGYIKWVHSQQAALWTKLDKVKEAQAGFVLRGEQEQHRQELKDDLDKYRSELRVDLVGIKTELDKYRAELRVELVGIKTDLDRYRTDLKSDLTSLETRVIKEMERIVSKGG